MRKYDMFTLRKAMDKVEPPNDVMVVDQTVVSCSFEKTSRKQVLHHYRKINRITLVNGVLMLIYIYTNYRDVLHINSFQIIESVIGR